MRSFTSGLRSQQIMGMKGWQQQHEFLVYLFVRREQRVDSYRQNDDVYVTREDTGMKGKCDNRFFILF